MHPAVTLLAVLIGLGTLSCNSPSPTPEIRLRASLLVSEEHTWFKAFDYFGQILDERSGGRIALETYPSEQLAKEIEAIRMIQAGVIDMTTTSALLSNWTEIITFAEMPFLNGSMAEVDTMLNGPVGERIRREMVDRDGTATRRLLPGRRAPPHLQSTHPPPGRPHRTRRPHPEYPGLRHDLGGARGEDDADRFFGGVYGPAAGRHQRAGESAAAHEDARYARSPRVRQPHEPRLRVDLPGHRRAQFQAMPADLQQIFLDCARDMQVYERTLFEENAEKTRAELEALGMEFVEVDRAAFVAKHGDAIYRTLSPEMQAVYRSLRPEAAAW